MARLPLLPCVAVVAVVALAQSVRGELPNSIGRHLGVGWSDGYHSRTACPPKRHTIHQIQHLAVPPTAPAAKPIPWWKIPAEPEPVPAPAPQPIGTTATFPPSGPSLFRQPGEGSSVTVQGTPNAPPSGQ